MSKNKMYCCCKTNKIKSFQHLAVAIKHNSRDWIPPNDNGTPSDVLVPYRAPEQAATDIKTYMPRKNAVLAIEYILIASPEWFDNATETQIKKWEQENLCFLENRHGREAIIGLCFHRGEQTIHGHAIVIPDENGKLNCRHFLGGAKKMRQLQDEYARYMKPFGLCRGESKLTPDAKLEKEFYQTVNKGKAYAKNIKPIMAEHLPAPTMADHVDPRQYASRLINRAITNMQVREGYLRAGLEEAEKRRKQIAKIAQQDRQRWKEIKQNPKLILELKEALAKEMAEKAQTQADYKRLIVAIREFFHRNIRPRDNLRLPKQLGALLDFPEIKQDVSYSLMPNQHIRQDMERTR